MSTTSSNQDPVSEREAAAPVKPLLGGFLNNGVLQGLLVLLLALSTLFVFSGRGGTLLSAGVYTLDVLFSGFILVALRRHRHNSRHYAQRYHIDRIRNAASPEERQVYLNQLIASSDLKYAPFAGVDLSSAGLKAVRLRWADLCGADLSSASLEGATLYRANLSYSKMDYALLTEANLNHANAQGASIRSADLRRATMQGINLKAAHLVDSDLSKTDLRRANLRFADLRGANLLGADLTGADLYQCILPDGARWTPVTDMRLYVAPLYHLEEVDPFLSIPHWLIDKVKQSVKVENER